MTQSAGDLPNHNLPSTVSTARGPMLAPALLLWIVAQIAALSISAARMPLWARFAQPAEDHALVVMLVVQIALSSMLSPMLLCTARHAVVAIFSSLPFTLLAGLLAAADFSCTGLGWMYAAAWMIVVACWINIARSAPAFVAALASSVSIGGMLLLYLRHEFGPSNPTSILPDALLGPIAGALAQVDVLSEKKYALLLMILLGIASGFVSLVVAKRRSPTTYPQPQRTIVDKSC